jgi:hypothetical protein
VVVGVSIGTWIRARREQRRRNWEFNLGFAPIDLDALRPDVARAVRALPADEQEWVRGTMHRWHRAIDELAADEQVLAALPVVDARLRGYLLLTERRLLVGGDNGFRAIALDLLKANSVGIDSDVLRVQPSDGRAHEFNVARFSKPVVVAFAEQLRDTV